MALNKLLIGIRVREIRENLFGETRFDFAKRCNLTERHIGQIERGDILLSLNTLDKIASATGISMDYILYGTNKHTNLKARDTLNLLMDRASKDELQMYYKCLTSIKSYMNKIEIDIKAGNAWFYKLVKNKKH